MASMICVRLKIGGAIIPAEAVPMMDALALFKERAALTFDHKAMLPYHAKPRFWMRRTPFHHIAIRADERTRIPIPAWNGIGRRIGWTGQWRWLHVVSPSWQT